MNEVVNFDYIKNKIEKPNETAKEKALAHQNDLIKPIGSLGELERISIKYAGITGEVFNKIDKKIVFLFGADNGIYDEGISSSPQHFTNFLMSCYGDGKGSGINVICKANNVDLKLVDMGIIGELDYSNIDNQKLMQGTNNFAKELSIPKDVVLKALDVGIQYAKYARDNGYNIIGTGEVGIGNTTTAAACIMAALGIGDPDLAVGKGAGLTDEMFENKKQVIKKALEMHKPDKNDAIDILTKVGGLDIVAITGLFVGAAYYKIPIVIDGLISISAALLASIINPLVKEYIFPSHVSEEPGYKIAADALDLTAFLNLKMRLGEGTGCPIAMMIIENALSVINNMTTFEELSADSKFRVMM